MALERRYDLEGQDAFGIPAKLDECGLTGENDIPEHGFLTVLIPGGQLRLFFDIADFKKIRDSMGRAAAKFPQLFKE